MVLTGHIIAKDLSKRVSHLDTCLNVFVLLKKSFLIILLKQPVFKHVSLYLFIYLLFGLLSLLRMDTYEVRDFGLFISK